MAPEAQAIMAVTDRVGAAFKGFFSWKKDRDEQRRKDTREAVKSLVLAASETRQYAAAVRDAVPNRRRRNSISRLSGRTPPWTWCRSIRCWLSDRIGWTQAQKDEQVIELDEVYQQGWEAFLGSS
jgi:hypothetical protein